MRACAVFVLVWTLTDVFLFHIKLNTYFLLPSNKVLCLCCCISLFLIHTLWYVKAKGFLKAPKPLSALYQSTTKLTSVTHTHTAGGQGVYSGRWNATTHVPICNSRLILHQPQWLHDVNTKCLDKNEQRGGRDAQGTIVCCKAVCRHLPAQCWEPHSPRIVHTMHSIPETVKQILHHRTKYSRKR
jgi:hypothetical protein